MSQSKSYIVRVRATVIKELICDGRKLTEEIVRANPFEYAEDETETEQVDYEVISVKPNE